MALSFKFYRAVEIGTGARDDPFRSKLAEYIVSDGSGAGFSDWHHPARPLRYHLARCDSLIHLQIAIDLQVKAWSSELSTEADVESWLQGPYSAVNQGDRDVIEADGINLGWAVDQNSRRDLWRYISRHHVIAQDLMRLKDQNALELFRKLLTATISQIPAAGRTKIQTWMQNKGLDTSWITGATLIRQVLQYVMENIQWPILQFHPFSSIIL